MSTMLRDNNFLGRKSAFILILALIFVFFTSCSNIGIFQNGGLVIAVPGSRSASESTIFTVTVADAAGIKDMLSKSLGSKNSINTVKATFDAFENLFDAKKIAANRGKSLKEMCG